MGYYRSPRTCEVCGNYETRDRSSLLRHTQTCTLKMKATEEPKGSHRRAKKRKDESFDYEQVVTPKSVQRRRLELPPQPKMIQNGSSDLSPIMRSPEGYPRYLVTPESISRFGCNSLSQSSQSPPETPVKTRALVKVGETPSVEELSSDNTELRPSSAEPLFSELSSLFARIKKIENKFEQLAHVSERLELLEEWVSHK